MNEKDVWNSNMEKDIKKLDNKLEIYDIWLDKFDYLIDNVNTTIIDLGCGIGNDTLYLLEKGKKVLSCDYSSSALEILKQNIPTSKTVNFDITKDFPSNIEKTELIISNLLLHYFDEKTTFEVIEKIKKLLFPNGYMIFRVNSINDLNYGANSGEEIEHHYFNSMGIKKRFFSKEDIYHFFNSWNITYCKEEKIHTKVHDIPKIVWEVIVQKQN